MTIPLFNNSNLRYNYVRFSMSCMQILQTRLQNQTWSEFLIH